jgi:hypothetical protein
LLYGFKCKGELQMQGNSGTGNTLEERTSHDKFDAFFKKLPAKKVNTVHGNVLEEVDHDINLLLASKWFEYQELIKSAIVDHIENATLDSGTPTELLKSLSKCVVSGALDIEKFKKIAKSLPLDDFPEELAALKKLYDISPLMLKISTDPVMPIPDKTHLLTDVYKNIDLSGNLFQGDHPLYKDMPLWMTDIVRDPLGYQRTDIQNKLVTTKQNIIVSFQEKLNEGIFGGVVIHDLSENNFEKLYQTHLDIWVKFVSTNDQCQQYAVLLEDAEKIADKIVSVESFLKKQAEKLQLNKIQLSIKSHQTVLDGEIKEIKNKIKQSSLNADEEIKTLNGKVNDLNLFSYLAPTSTPFIFPENLIPIQNNFQIFCKLLFAKEIADELETSIHTKDHLRVQKPQQQFDEFEEKFKNAKNILKHFDEIAVKISGNDVSGIGMSLLNEIEKILVEIKAELNKKTARKK